MGVISKVTDVVAIYLDDRSGGLASVLSILKNEEVSVEYMYAFLGRKEGKALMVVKADDEAKIEKVLSANNIPMATQSPADKAFTAIDLFIMNTFIQHIFKTW